MESGACDGGSGGDHVVAVHGAAARGLGKDGRVSAELRRSSSATSEELEQLLAQLSEFEQHLMQQVDGSRPAGGSASPDGGGVGSGLQADNSLSWSQTLAGLAHLLPPADAAGQGS
jgi:hypothetical protein